MKLPFIRLRFPFLIKGMGSILLIIIGINQCTKGIIYPPVLKEIGTEKYPGVDGVIVYDSTKIEVNEDGTSISTQHKMIKILSTYGKKKFGEQTFAFCTKWDTLMVVSARVYNPTGEIIEVPDENIDIYPMPAWEGAKFFIPNVYMVKITYPQIEIWSTIEYTIKDIYYEPLFANHFQYYTLFESEYPLREKVVQIDIPKKMDLKWTVLRGDIPFKKEDKRDREIYNWSTRDVKAIEKEAVMPPIRDVATKLLVSTLPSWEYFSKWYYKVSKPTFETDSVIKEFIAELIKPEMNNEEKIRALFNWTVENIRYVETTLSGAKAGFKPALATQTYERKYGVCRDKAAFLVALLKEIGIDAYIVITNPMEMVEENLPVDQFNHAVVAVKGDKGYYYLDPTVENSRDYLPAFEYNGKAMLISSEKGEPMRYSAPQAPEKNSMNLIGKSSLDKNNKLTGTLTIETSGIMDLQFRTLFKQFPPEMKERIVTSFIMQSNPSAVVDTFFVKGLSSLDEPLSIILRYHIDDYASEMGELLTLNPPLGGGGNVSVQFGMGNPFALDERKYPINLMVTLKTSYREVMEIPSNYKISKFPDEFDISNEYISLRQCYKSKKNKIVINSDFSLKRARIPAENYPEVKKALKEADKYKGQKILLKRR